MIREIREYKKPGSVYPEVVIMDTRGLLHGEYSVDVIVGGGDGYVTVYMSRDFEKCVEEAKKYFSEYK